MTVGGEPFLVQNGLRQGCTIAPTLFILLVIDSWLSRCHVAGVEVQFKLGGKLVGERTRRPNSFVLSECFFVDDTALVCSCREDMVLAARTFDEIATKYAWSYSECSQDKVAGRLRSCTTGNIALGGGLEANIALGFASFYIILSTTPSCYIFRIALAALL